MLDPERKNASFNKQLLSHIVYNDKQGYQRFLHMQNIIDKDPILRFDPSTIQRSRAELISIYSKKLIRYSEIFPQNQVMHGYKTVFFEQQLPLGLHDYMFLITLRNLCDDQQRKAILGPAERGEILGCYAQTELGHGSDVQSLMTTATYDEETQTFIVNTPQIKAAKWWIGDLGIFCNHACVFAQLIIKGKNYGVHAFVVPVRDKNHKPFAGVEVGDIGPKVGYNTKDNGYLILTNYRIPRTNMLMKYHKVSKNGEYKVQGDEKITYATMLLIRASMPFVSFIKTSKAITIITRYSLARRQFKDNKGVEIPILDYQLQQQKIFPRIAETFASLFAFHTIKAISVNVMDEAYKGDFSRLQQAHVISSAMKAITTRDGLRGIQILRRSGGGHGYSSYSGLPALQNELAPTFTYEGQFTILQLQVARFLLKAIKSVMKGKPLKESVAYIANITNEPFRLDTDNEEILTKPENIIKIFEQNSLQRTKKAGQRLKSGIDNGLKAKSSWDIYSGIQLVDAATAHGYYLMVKYFFTQIKHLCKDQKLFLVLIDLFKLYSVQKIIQNTTSFFQTEVLSSTSLKTYRLIRQKLFNKIRPQALALVESFGYSDNNLHSAIGRSDGKPYEHLLDWAKNKNDVNKPEHAQDIRRNALVMWEKSRQIFQSHLQPKL